MVTVLLFGQTLRQSAEESEFQLDVTGPMTVRALLEANQDKLGGVLAYLNKGELVVTVNRKVGTEDSMVRDGDTVKLTHQFNPSYDGATDIIP
ncbi:MAG: MoaD/ThiS family protein [Nitrospirae bacterium]|nr:MoaD/ThiS family protein [Nitrospirota bacterium]